PPPRQEEILAIDYGAIGRLLLRRPSDDAPFDRALLLLGKAVERPADSERAGFWVRADLPSLDLDDWLSFSRALPSRGTGAVDFDGADIDGTSVYEIGRKFRDTIVVARRGGGGWGSAVGRGIGSRAGVRGETRRAGANGRCV